MSGVVLNTALKSTLLSLKQTSNLIDDVTFRLASGKKVNSALDNPQNFFDAAALNNDASDLTRLLDGISQNIKALEQASNGLEATSKLLDQAQSLALNRKAEIEAINIPAAKNGQSGLSNLITDKGADFYFRLDDDGPAADDAGDIGTSATYTGSIATEQDGLFKGAKASAYFDGINDGVNIGYNPLISGNFQEKTIELVFNASSTNGKQALYSQGNAFRGFDIYLDGEELYVTANNPPFFGGASAIAQPIFKTTIEGGRNYHVAMVYSSAENRIEAFVNGQSIGSSEIANGTFFGHNAPTIGRSNAPNKTLHDGLSSSIHYFNGFISDVAIHNTPLTIEEIAEHATAAGTNNFNSTDQDYLNIINDIQRIAIDSNYRSASLLRGNDILTQFNATGTSTITTEGIDIEGRAKGLPQSGFASTTNLDRIINDIKEFRDEVRAYSLSLTNDINIIKIRKEFTRDIISTLIAGKDDLTLSDQNEDGANLLALQTRQQLGVTALSLAAQSTQQTLRLF